MPQQATTAALYRGYEVFKNTVVGTFEWADENNLIHDGFDKEEGAFDAIDAHRRALRASAV